MKIDIGEGIRSLRDLTPDDQSWYADYVPDIIVNASGIPRVADRYEFGGPASQEPTIAAS
jgi:hypothetical protein